MLAEADMGVTTMAMGGSNARYAADNTLLVKFYNHPRLDAKASKAEGRNIYKEVPYIQIMTPGNKDSIVARPATQMDIDRFPEHFQKFKAREDQASAVEGTLLSEWPAVTRSQVEELKYLNILTVEQLAAVSDSNAGGIMGINLLKSRAKAFLEASQTQKAADEMRKLQDTVNAQAEQIAKLTAALEVQSESKPKRGRPRKQTEEAAEE